jgi:adenylate kinase
MKLIFLGPPGAGKGTQAQQITRDFGIVQISTGDMLRTQIRNNTPLGIKANEFIKNGNLVPDNLIIDMIDHELSFTDLENGYLLDGFPRTLGQARALDNILESRHEKIDAVLILDVPEDNIVRRLSGRRVCRKTGKTFHIIYNPPTLDDGVLTEDLYQREDDKEETVRNRLGVYARQTEPLINYYTKKGVAHHVDGTGKLDEVYKRIKEILIKEIEKVNIK